MTVIILIKPRLITILLSKKSSLNGNVKYSPSKPKQRNTKWQIIWFDPPNDVNVKPSNGKLIMRLTDKHFVIINSVMINFINSTATTLS